LVGDLAIIENDIFLKASELIPMPLSILNLSLVAKLQNLQQFN